MRWSPRFTKLRRAVSPSRSKASASAAHERLRFGEAVHSCEVLSETVHGQGDVGWLDRFVAGDEKPLAEAEAFSVGGFGFGVLSAHGQDRGEVEEAAGGGAGGVADGLLADGEASAEEALNVVEVALVLRTRSRSLNLATATVFPTFTGGGTTPQERSLMRSRV